MSVSSLLFVFFVFALFVLYYLVPSKYQWSVLLIGSCIFYLSFGIAESVYIVISATVVYAAARIMQKTAEQNKQYLKDNKDILSKEEKTAFKNKTKKARKALMLAALFIVLSFLLVFKYGDFAIQQINSVSGIFGRTDKIGELNLIAPIGISFYTFQSIGYLLDIYWEYYECEKHYLKFLLYISFFPQIIQGPINDFEVFSKELFSPYEPSYKNFSYGAQRMVWGYFKKMVVADCISHYVNSAFLNYSSYIGLACLLGAFAYSVEIYADFSGYMDIMCGICEMFGIRLTENFERPYFSKSVAEYWRRWHISLGAWFKKYIYYPIGMSTKSRTVSKHLRKKFGKSFADNVPATFALIITWAATGLWHGANWSYIIWGLLNGLFIILTLWLEPFYEKTKTKLHINSESRLWAAFCTVRTFLLITIIKIIPEVGSSFEGLAYIKRIFTEHSIPTSFSQLLPFVSDKLNFLVIIFGIVLMFAVSILQRKKPFREYFNKLPQFIRIMCLCGLIMIIFVFGIVSSGNRGFMYAQF